MAITIPVAIKISTTAGHVPVSTNFTRVGELAVNRADGKLWVWTGSVVKQIIGAPGPPGPPGPGTPPPPPDPSRCFLGSARVRMATGSIKNIEHIEIGEYVLGRYGEHNEVLALDRPLLGHRVMWLINEDHWTTDEHPHWTTEGPKRIEPDRLKIDWGHRHPVITRDGTIRYVTNTGLIRPVTKLRANDELIYFGGVRELKELSFELLPIETKLFNLMLGGSHTYWVDDYLVTGWPQETDFNYDTWTNK